MALSAKPLKSAASAFGKLIFLLLARGLESPCPLLVWYITLHACVIAFETSAVCWKPMGNAFISSSNWLTKILCWIQICHIVDKNLGPFVHFFHGHHHCKKWLRHQSSNFTTPSYHQGFAGMVQDFKSLWSVKQMKSISNKFVKVEFDTTKWLFKQAKQCY